MFMPVSWKKTLLYAGIAVVGCTLAVFIIGVAAPLIAVAIGCAVGFSGSAAVNSASKTGVKR
jgi:hypothetical protein